jgi:ribose 5-phosphate isomerase A
MKWDTKIAERLEWSKQIDNRAEKEKAAAELAARVRDGEVIGFGSGSTAYLTILAIGARIQAEGLRITAIPTSLETSLVCANLGIPTASLAQQRPDWAFDGADEVDPQRSLIKGRGGAMFREKMIIASAPKTFIVVDRSKLVERLGQKFPVPVEAHPEAVNLAERGLARLGAQEIVLRMARAKDGPVITESGNFILDARFDPIEPGLERAIKALVGVIESGLFVGYPVEVVVAS